MSKSPADYNKEQMESGELTWEHISTLAMEFQNFSGLVADGKIGPKTIAELGYNPRVRYEPPCVPVLPLPVYGGRLPHVSSGHFLVNPSRAPGTYKHADGTPYAGHQGQDWMYRYLHGDPPKQTLKSNRYDGNWWVPEGISALCVFPAARVLSTIYSDKRREWTVTIDMLADNHVANGWRAIYRHLETVVVRPNDRVLVGQSLGLVGGGVTGLVHLHFELYAPGRHKYTESLEPSKFFARHGTKI